MVNNPTELYQSNDSYAVILVHRSPQGKVNIVDFLVYNGNKVAKIIFINY
jgi:hypothetical protein